VTERLEDQPRSRIPTLAEMRDWYVSIQTPSALELREEIAAQMPVPRVMISSATSGRPWRATPHATLDGLTPLCGRFLAQPKLEDPRFRDVTCKRCIAELDDLGLDML